MKNVLIPTDFSDCASNAMDFGIALAQLINVKLFVFTNLNIPENWEELDGEENGITSEHVQIIKNKKVLLGHWKEKAEKENVLMETLITGGNFLESLEKQVKIVKADLVVMGSHGASGKQEYFIGSNTQKAIRKLFLPVIVIKNPVSRIQFKNVVFASAFEEKEKIAFQYLLDFLDPFSPETIHLLTINTSEWFSQPAILMEKSMNDFQEMCTRYKCKSHFYKSVSVDAGIRQFSQDTNPDLIAISHLDRNPILRIFTGSKVEALVNHAERPVLCIGKKD